VPAALLDCILALLPPRSHLGAVCRVCRSWLSACARGAGARQWERLGDLLGCAECRCGGSSCYDGGSSSSSSWSCDCPFACASPAARLDAIRAAAPRPHNLRRSPAGRRPGRS
jgi:hypothetical protein